MTSILPFRAEYCVQEVNPWQNQQRSKLSLRALKELGAFMWGRKIHGQTPSRVSLENMTRLLASTCCLLRKR